MEESLGKITRFLGKLEGNSYMSTRIHFPSILGATMAPDRPLRNV